VGWPDRAIAGIGATQRALITRAQLSDLGLGPSAIEHALRRGRLHRIHQGLYSMVPFPALPDLAIELAAVLACGDALSARRLAGAGRQLNRNLEAILVRIAAALASRAA
jgi:Transcriptional regulator, AbiEi antitoxin